jgi:hypothetical protein
MEVTTPLQALRLLRTLRFLAGLLFLVGLGMAVLCILLILDHCPDADHLLPVVLGASVSAMVVTALIDRTARPHEVRFAEAAGEPQEPRGGFEVILIRNPAEQQ